jgi:hypothetical protein
MKEVLLSRKQKMLMRCAPFNEQRLTSRAMRSAVFRAKKNDEYVHQQAFDRAIAALVHRSPVPAEVADWFTKETTVAPPKRTWKTIAFNPAVLAIVIALLVIGTIFGIRVMERMNDFAGADTARKLLTSAASTRSVMLDPIKTDAGALADLFFMKHRLNHYDVPPEFAELKTIGTRVFDNEEIHDVAQIWVVEKHMQFFLFPAERDVKSGKVLDFSGWRYVEQEGWVGVVHEKNGVCFMACLRGQEKDLASYIAKSTP